MPTLPWSFFALVCYIPDPLGAYLDRLRQSFPADDHAQAHLTILPPRPIYVPVETALDTANAVLQQTFVFDVELQKVSRFAQTNILYLTVGEGNAVVRELHAALNSGHLSYDEPFEFLPHVTVGGPVTADNIADANLEAEREWARFSEQKTFGVREIVALGAKPHVGSYGAWQRVHSYKLTPTSSQANSAVTGRTS